MYTVTDATNRNFLLKMMSAYAEVVPCQM
jgi:hypothetical protein